MPNEIRHGETRVIRGREAGKVDKIINPGKHGFILHKKGEMYYK